MTQETADQITSSVLTAALSHLAPANPMSQSPVGRPLRSRLSPLQTESSFWNLSPGTGWRPMTGSRHISPSHQPGSPHHSAATGSEPESASSRNRIDSVSTSEYTSAEPSPTKGRQTGGQDMSLGPEFFADSVFQQQQNNLNDGNVTLYDMGQNQMSSLVSQRDLLPQSGHRFWSETTSFNNQFAGRTPAAIWSSPPPFSPLSYGSSAAHVTTVPPGFPVSNLNPQAATWTSRSTGSFGVSRQPDYLTGSPAGVYAQPCGTNGLSNNSGQRSNYAGGSMDMVALEEQFRDFKLKPKILTEQFRSDMHAGRRNRSRNRRPVSVQCVFCLSNGEEEKVYRSHVLKDPEGRVVCPVLRMYSCPICNNNGGDYAHTIKYCPKNKPNHKQMLIAKAQTGQLQEGLMMQSLRSPFAVINRK